MSEPKAQLVDPQGNMNLPGMNATGVITATSFSGEGGVVTGLTGGGNLNVGVVTATSFVGDGTGHAANLTGTPNLNLGLTTATSFVGDATGKAAGLTGTPNLNVGLITATGFTADIKGDVTGNITGNVTGNIVGDVTGNITGFASSIKSGNSLGVGVCTAIQYHGNGSNLTGAGSSAYIAQEITATSAETIIDLSDGNTIYYKGGKTTVGFASTSAAEQITIIRDPSPTFTAAYNESFSTGGVTFDGNDYLSMADNAAFQLGTDDWTIEFFWKSGSGNTGNYQQLIGTQTNDTGTTAGIWRVGTRTASNQIYFSRADGSGFEEPIWDVDVNDEAWHHIAFTRESGSVYCYVDGQKQTNVGESNAISGTMTTSNPCYIGYNTRDGTYITGTVSSARIVKGTAVYTATFLPPSAELTNVTNTVLLCCQSNSSTTATTVSAGTITANGDPAAGAQTVAYSGTNTFDNSGVITWPSTVKWNGGTTPTLISNDYTSAFQIFRLTTGDTGASYQAWEEMQSTSKQVSLWFWGRANYGTSGLNDRTKRSSPAQIPGNWSAEFFGSKSNLVAVVPRSDGTLWSWGYNASGGLLGLNDNVSRSSPTQIGTDTTWKQSTTGSGKQALAIKTDGTLWSWGDNDFGDLGQNYAHENGRVSSPTQVGTGSDWKQVSADASKTSAFKTDGTLWVWGSNGDGGLGLNNTTTISSPAQIPGTTWDSTSVTNVGDTYSGGCIKTDGTLWVWGRNQSGDLGQNQSGTIPQGGVYYSSPTQMGTGTDWASVMQTGNSGLGTKTDGTLWAWGRNNAGALGQNDTITRSSPVQIPGTNWSNDPQDINMEDIGSGNAWAIKTDGTLWVWGDKGYDGSLGQNQAPAQGTSVSSPIQVGTATDWAAIPGVSSNSYAVLGMRYSP